MFQISLPRLKMIDEASTMTHKPIGMLTLANAQSKGSPLHKVDTLPLKYVDRVVMATIVMHVNQLDQNECTIAPQEEKDIFQGKNN